MIPARKKKPHFWMVPYWSYFKGMFRLFPSHFKKWVWQNKILQNISECFQYKVTKNPVAARPDKSEEWDICSNREVNLELLVSYLKLVVDDCETIWYQYLYACVFRWARQQWSRHPIPSPHPSSPSPAISSTVMMLPLPHRAPSSAKGKST